MDNLPIINELKLFKKENYTKFFMPGHLQLVCKQDYTSVQKEVFGLLKEFEKDIFSFDVTEVNNFDNLANPNGIIQKSQEILSKDFGAKRAYFLVNGSTVGILSMVCAVTKNKDKIIIQKNSHKSVYNACKINDLSVVYIDTEKNNEFDIFEKMDLIKFENILNQNKDAKAVVITSPDYYGQNQNIEKLAQITHKYNMLLLVDSAHSPHYIYSEDFQKNAIYNGADIMVVSFHKTLPTLNQTALMFANNSLNDYVCDKLQEKLNIFQTTSPSYILLANIELTNNILKKYGKELYKNLKNNIENFKMHIKTLNKMLEKSDKNFYVKILNNDDFSRIVISTPNIKNTYKILKEEYKILPEMVNEKSIVFICNIFHTKHDFDLLYEAFEHISKKYLNIKGISLYTDRKDVFFKENVYEKKLSILNYLKENIGENCKKSIYSYPPGVPIVSEHEIINSEHIRYVSNIINNVEIDLFMG
ncbi:MAG: aminotransferase class I/II-fold pyridoxal phosphate-dependent enzyme [Peptoanaerobacter stomatis]|uniref:aminotransferase class I/II-fold pyridoxal phosphate-dependent enzyme n=1 Tax=Peptoanaerobacter stomatis TaxID=796937 RepID=UPI003FA12A98